MQASALHPSTLTPWGIRLPGPACEAGAGELEHVHLLPEWLAAPTTLRTVRQDDRRSCVILALEWQAEKAGG